MRRVDTELEAVFIQKAEREVFSPAYSLGAGQSDDGKSGT